MKPGRIARFLLLAALPCAATAALAQENPFRLKPEARGTVCLDCHVDFEDTMKRAHVHTPAAAGDCADCHDPHASEHGKLLSFEPQRICLECHGDMGAEGAHSAHDAVASGQCVTCHDPHASEHENLLLADASELCSNCHAEIVSRVASNRFGHPPAEDDCLSCHDPHRSTDSDSLLVIAEPSLCVTCHDTDAEAFGRQHLGYPVGEARCTSCHDPHGSNVGGILHDNVHAPVRDKMCRQCHADAEATTPLALRSEGLTLCRGCHADTVNEALLANRVHWPVVDDRACLNCHAAHASSEAGLLVEPMKPLCGSCHGDVQPGDDASLVTHAPVEEGLCTGCHAPHASDHGFLLVEARGTELCGNCHEWREHSAHPIGPEVVDQRNPNLTVDCNSCHQPHASEHESFAHFETKRELCVQCHQQYGR